MTTQAPFYVVGPTGSGKSGLALRLAEQWQGEIVNADAYQIYRGLPIITAAPSAEDRARVPHHLYETVGLDEDYHVARYAEEAQSAMREIQSRGKRPIVVGGNGLYVKALTHGLADSPPGDPKLRESLGEMSDASLVAWLEMLDPAGARAMNLKNPRYVMRSLEMTLLTGVSASVLKASWKRESPTGIEGISLCWDRAALYARIDARVSEMVARGAVEEVAALPDRLSATASKAIGVRELQAYLRGVCSLDDAIRAIQQASRRYAKRQETWFRKETVFARLSFEEASDWALG